MTDREARETALGILAIKTQATRFDAMVLSAYLDDADIQAVHTHDFLAACDNLKKNEWFPKMGELLTACASAKAARIREQEKNQRLALRDMTPPTKEEAERILNKLYQATGKKRPVNF